MSNLQTQLNMVARELLGWGSRMPGCANKLEVICSKPSRPLQLSIGAYHRVR